MRKKISAMLAVLAVACIGAVPVFAISEQEAEQIVKNEYPGATINRVERDYERGRKVYEVDFQTDEIWDGDVTINVETGRIVDRDIDCRDRGHRHNRHCDW